MSSSYMIGLGTSLRIYNKLLSSCHFVCIAFYTTLAGIAVRRIIHCKAFASITDGIEMIYQFVFESTLMKVCKQLHRDMVLLKLHYIFIIVAFLYSNLYFSGISLEFF